MLHVTALYRPHARDALRTHPMRTFGYHTHFFPLHIPHQPLTPEETPKRSLMTIERVQLCVEPKSPSPC